MESLRQSCVDISKIKVKKDAATGTAVIYVNERGNNCIVVAAGANQECDTAYLKENEKLFQEYEYILLQMEIPYDKITSEEFTSFLGILGKSKHARKFQSMRGKGSPIPPTWNGGRKRR